MDIEVSLKIRSAIKAKLVELGCHVDEELPDYIMVLIANRRTRTHMEEDLNLFLGDNTSAFTLWLHHVLKKLEQITTTGTGKAPGLFADDVSASVDAATATVKVDAAAGPSSAVENVTANVNILEESSGTNKKKSSKKEVDDKTRQKAETAAEGSSSPKSRIKLNKINLNLSPTKSKSSKESRSSKSEQVDPIIPEDKHKSKSDPPEYISLSSAGPRLSFKIPGSNFKKTSSGTKRKAEDEDFTDCLNLKAEADDEDFLEPTAPPAKSKAKIARKPILPPGDDGNDLELLRQKVIDSTRRKGPIATRLRQQAEAEKLKESELEQIGEAGSAKKEKNISPQDKEESGRHGDRKKISSRNIESLNKLLKSNVEVKRERERENLKGRSRSPRSSRNDDSENRRRLRRDSPDREVTPRDARHRLTNKRKLGNEIERYQPPNKMRSTIGMVSMTNRTTSRHHFEKEEEYDPSCPEVNVNANKLQSIIKVPERSQKSAALQDPLNKKLLFRAMADAEKSLLQTRQITSKFEEKESERRQRQQQRRNSSLSPVSRNIRRGRDSPPVSRNLQRGKKSIHERLGYVARKSVSPAENLDLEPGHTIEEWEYMDDDEDDLEMSQFRNFGDDEIGIIINIPNESNVGRNVMLDTKDNSSDMMNQRHQLGQMTQPRSISIQVHSDDDDDDDDSSSTEDDDENNNNASDRDRSGNTTMNDNEDSVPSNPAQDQNQSADYEIVLNESNINLPSPSDQNEMENSTLSNGGSRNDFSLNSKKIVARGSDSRIQITLNNDVAQPLPMKTYQPAFSPMPLQQSQPPIQPQQQICKFWPNCTFSDKCMYTHPPCKFNTKCTKPNCPYKHIGFTKNTIPFHLQSLNPRSNVGKPAAGPSGTNGVKVCKYFPKCHTMSCPFFHPTPCRFGTGCTDLKCKNYHPGITVAKKKFNAGPPGKIPTAQFKWKAPTTTATPTPASGSGSGAASLESEVKTE